jgi:hypothetical protein
VYPGIDKSPEVPPDWREGVGDGDCEEGVDPGFFL